MSKISKSNRKHKLREGRSLSGFDIRRPESRFERTSFARWTAIYLLLCLMGEECALKHSSFLLFVCNGLNISMNNLRSRITLVFSGFVFSLFLIHCIYKLKETGFFFSRRKRLSLFLCLLWKARHSLGVTTQWMILCILTSTKWSWTSSTRAQLTTSSPCVVQNSYTRLLTKDALNRKNFDSVTFGTLCETSLMQVISDTSLESELV